MHLSSPAAKGAGVCEPKRPRERNYALTLVVTCKTASNINEGTSSSTPSSFKVFATLTEIQQD
jgi:hypothetical protein